MIQLAWLIPLLPLAGWALNALFGKRLNRSSVAIIACVPILAAFAVSTGILFEISGSIKKQFIVELFPWINAGGLSAAFAFLIDPLTCVFLMIITGIGFLIHLYSVGYMAEDEGFARFFAYLNLFVFFMLLLVMGENYLIMFVGWEGVGLCSYLLIGFWFKVHEYNMAAKKAFVMNRIGDLGFILGIFLLFVNFNSVSYTEIFDQVPSMKSGDPILVTACLLLFVGAMGKSAQIPLYTWLPDAMAGPTPVSALIHAATMVTAGIYMIARSNILYTMAPLAMEVVAITGLLTALFAAAIGLFQNDIKKVLAYSTVSQLGYMFLGLGVGAYTGAVFHVMTHAFFKALLFLAAGSVIHALHHEQDIRNMGGLKNKTRVTFLTFLIGTIAISGLPPLSGFFSKDEILAHTFSHNKLFWFFGLLGSMLTAFYMFRLLFLTFFGKFRGGKEKESHIHESPSSMTIPLVVLAILSIVGGGFGFPSFTGLSHHLNDFLSPVFAGSTSRLVHGHLSHTTEYLLIALAVAAASAAIYYAWKLFVKEGITSPAEGEKLSPIRKLIYHKFYVDEFYDSLITKPLDRMSSFFYSIVEIKGIDAVVNGVGEMAKWTGGIIRKAQTGYVSFYLWVMALAIAATIFFKLL